LGWAGERKVFKVVPTAHGERIFSSRDLSRGSSRKQKIKKVIAMQPDPQNGSPHMRTKKGERRGGTWGAAPARKVKKKRAANALANSSCLEGGGG